MQYFADLLVSGLAIGAIYGLIAIAFAVIYKSTGLLNFAQGEMTMLITYIAWSVSTAASGNPFLVAAAAVVSAVILGFVIERLVIRPMLGEPIFSIVMVTVGLAVILRSLILLVWDAYPHALDIGVGRELIKIGATGFRSGQIAVILVLLAMLGGFWLFFRYSRFGIAMRAVANDDRTALLMGVSASRVHAVAWASSSVISGIAGVFFAMIYDLSPGMYHLGLKAFPSTILGGLDSVIGSGFSGLIVGVAENLAGGYLSPASKEIAGFILIIVVLMVRPFGLFGEREIERV